MLAARDVCWMLYRRDADDLGSTFWIGVAGSLPVATRLGFRLPVEAGRGHLGKSIAATGVTPAVNQMELHPCFQQRELRAAHAEHGILTEAWAPLGQGAVLQDSELAPSVRRTARPPRRSCCAGICSWASSSSRSR